MHHKEQFCEIILNLGQWFRRCCLKDFYLELWKSSCFVEQNHLCSFEKGHHGEHSCEFGPVVQEEMLFKGISYQELWQPFCSVDQNHLCNFGRRYHEEQFCEIILNLGQWFRRECCLKVFLIWSSDSPLFNGV